MPIARVRKPGEMPEPIVETETSRPRFMSRRLISAFGVLAVGTAAATGFYVFRARPHVTHDEWSVFGSDRLQSNAFVGMNTPRRDVADRAFKADLETETGSNVSVRLSGATIRLGHCSTSSVVASGTPEFTYKINDMTSGDTVQGDFEYVDEDKALVQCDTATGSNYDENRSGWSRVLDTVQFRTIEQNLIFTPVVRD